MLGCRDARLARAMAVGVAHHVTQRGNGRGFILSRDEDRRVYLQLLAEQTLLIRQSKTAIVRIRIRISWVMNSDLRHLVCISSPLMVVEPSNREHETFQLGSERIRSVFQ